MTIDLALLGVVLLFAVLGAFSGAARQLGQLAALICAYMFARPLGALLGPWVAKGFGGPAIIGTIAGTIAASLLLFYSIRAGVTWLLQRALRWRGKGEMEDPSMDRSLGFVFGGLKVLAILWVALSALTFLHEHVQFAGKKLGVSAKDSLSFQLAAHYNLFEMSQFEPAQDLIKLARARSQPEQLRQLKESDAFKELKADSRFRRALEERQLQRAVESGDPLTVLDSAALLKLLSDEDFARKLADAARVLEDGPMAVTTTRDSGPTVPPAVEGPAASP